jgi:hypothetical protein
MQTALRKALTVTGLMLALFIFGVVTFTIWKSAYDQDHTSRLDFEPFKLLGLAFAFLIYRIWITIKPPKRKSGPPHSAKLDRADEG